MNIMKRLTVGGLAIGISLGIGLSNVSAAIPTEAKISGPKNEIIIGSSATMTKTISWGGGNGIYNVKYHDGITTRFTDPAANYYSTTRSSTYHLGSLSTDKWNLTLTVSSAGGGTARATGTVTLRK
ncbi:hypothetical protein [Niallia circulans]|jgi:hypothetical protein|nr:hypothetical protein [Niallia circulans]MCF2650456.1 hypothetical protein [Niallia circulans]